MMLAWQFAARDAEAVARLLRCLGRHRYVREVDHRLHWSVDHALADLPGFRAHAEAFERRLATEHDLDPASRDPSLWRSANVEEVALALGAFWAEGDVAERRRERLLDAAVRVGLDLPEHDPFASPPDDPPHPELVLLDWVLLPVDELDAERHAGALAAMEAAGEEVDPSAPVYQEGPILSAAELCLGSRAGRLVEDFVVWSDGPYAYADYVFRGASTAAKLERPPEGFRDL